MMLIVQIIMEASAVLVKLDVPTMVSIDINEYSSGTDMYSDHAMCTNTVGRYACDCKFDYRDDGRTCVDISEFADNTHNC